ncbi:MAG: ArnT family glycosyltransferase [Bacteroidia bacterium]
MIQVLKQKQWILICIIGLITRLIILPYSHVVDPDVFSRIFISLEWLEKPHLISTAVWPPLHFYIMSFFLWLFPFDVLTPKLLHIAFAVATAIPMYYFIKNEFNAKGAFWATLFYQLSPIVFRNSFHALAETPFVFFVVCSLYFISELFKHKEQITYAIWAGIFLTIACGIRYEGWVFIGFIGIVVLIRSGFKNAFVFGFFSMIFPLYWMIGNYLAEGDPLYSINSANYWNTVMEGVNEQITDLDHRMRVMFFPFSVFLFLTPLLSIISVVTLIVQTLKRNVTWKHLLWSIPFIGIMLMYIQKTYDGSLLMHHRYSAIPLLFLSPYLSYFFSDKIVLTEKFKKIIATLIITSAIPLSFYLHFIPFEKVFFFSPKLEEAISQILVSNYLQTEAVPHLYDKNAHKINEILNKELKNTDGLIIDFCGWEVSSFLALESNLPHHQILLMEGAKNGINSPEQIAEFINKYPEGILLIQNESRIDELVKIEGNCLQIKDTPHSIFVKKIFNGDGRYLLRYSSNTLCNTESKDEYEVLKNLDYYRMKIKNDKIWLKDVWRKAMHSNISRDEAITRDAQWMLENAE